MSSGAEMIRNLNVTLETLKEGSLFDDLLLSAPFPFFPVSFNVVITSKINSTF